MKSLKSYITEANSINWKSVFKRLNDKDKKEIQALSYDDKSNTYYSMKEIEDMFLYGNLKNKLDDYWNLVIEWLNGLYDTSEVAKIYGLSRSGNQHKAEVIAQVFDMLKNEL